jgi:hypothetical protein
MRKFRKRCTVGVVLLLTAGLIVTDAPLGFTSNYWTKHSMASGMLSGLLLLLLALMVVEDFVARREERAWRHVAAMAKKNLAYASGALGKAVAELAGVSIDDDSERLLGVERLRRIRSRDPLPGETAAEKFRFLATDPEHVDRFLGELELLKQRHREFMAQWAPVMVTVGQHAEILDRHATLNEMILWLQRPCRRKLWAQNTDWPDIAAARLDEFLMCAAELHEFTMRQVEGQSQTFTSSIRRTLSPPWLALLESLDAVGVPHAIAPDWTSARSDTPTTLVSGTKP